MDELSERVIGAAIRVHRELGPGLLESAYEACLAFELRESGLQAFTQVPLPVVYRGVKLDCGYRLDFVVEGQLLIELKAVERLQPIHEAQILSYLKLSGIRLGLLMNFHNQLLKDGIKRIVLNY